MKSHAPKAMDEPFDNNPLTKMWVTINNNTLLTNRLNEFLKLTKIVVMSIFGSLKDKHTFSTLAFMKDKLHNSLELIWTQFLEYLHKSFMHTKTSFIKMQS
jgi:hypothetical protein